MGDSSGGGIWLALPVVLLGWWSGAVAACLVFNQGLFTAGLGDLFGSLLGLVGNFGDPRWAWGQEWGRQLPGPVPLWGCVFLATVFWSVVAALILSRVPTMFGQADRERLGQDLGSRFAKRKDVVNLEVESPVPGRMVLGVMADRGPGWRRVLLAGESPGSVTVRAAAWRFRKFMKARSAGRSSLLVVGPSQTGKSAMLQAMINAWDGPAVVISVKADLIHETVERRRMQGEVRSFDPTRATEVNGTALITPSSWSPVLPGMSYAMAMSAAAQLVGSWPGSSNAENQYFTGSAEGLLTAYLYFAAHSGHSMADVCRWVRSAEKIVDGEDSELSGIFDEITMKPVENWAEVRKSATKALERIQGVSALGDNAGEIFATAAQVLQPFDNPDVEASSATVDFDLDWLTTDGTGANTIYISVPVSEAKTYGPVIGSCVGSLLAAVANHFNATGKPLDRPVLFVVDEAANIKLRDLAEMASTVNGMGLQLVTVWQSFSQIEEVYGRENAGTIWSNHRLKVVFGGQTDASTLEMVQKLLGQEEVIQRTMQSGAGLVMTTATGYQTQTQMMELAPLDVIRRMNVGDAALIATNLRPVHIRTIRSRNPEFCWWDEMLERTDKDRELTGPLPESERWRRRFGDQAAISHRTANAFGTWAFSVAERTAARCPDWLDQFGRGPKAAA